MWRITISNLLANKRRLIGTGSAVMLGVAFMAGTLVLGDTMDNGFANTFTTANAGTDVVVRSTTAIAGDQGELRGPIDAALVPLVAEVEGVDVVVPQTTVSGQIVGSDGTALGGQGPPTFVANWIDDTTVNPFRVTAGRTPRAETEVLIDQGSADAGKLAVGDRTTVLLPQPVEVTVVGIGAFGDADSIGGATFAFFATDALDALLARRDSASGVNSILVTAEEGVAPDGLARRISRVLPDGVESVTSDQVTTEQLAAIGDDFLDFFKGFLVAFAGIALLVATFSIHNTFAVVLAQRTRESALLRALGATRRQVLTATAAETVMIGVVASAVGLLAGLGLASGLMSLLDAGGVGVPTDGLTVEASSLWIAGLVGVVATVVAGLGPSWSAARVPPLAALRNVAIERLGTTAWRALGGTLLLVGGLVAAAGPALDLWSSPISVIGVGAASVLVGVVVLGPLLAGPVASWVGRPAAWAKGITGGLARQNAMRNPRRTASTATALMVGVGVVTLFMVIGASLEASVTQSVAKSLRADLLIEAESGPVARDVPEAVLAVDGVRSAIGVGMGSVLVDGEGIGVNFVEFAEVAAALDLDVEEGSLDTLTDDQIAVARSAADERGWEIGSVVDVGFVDGQSERLEVGAVFRSEEFADGMIVAASTYAAHNTELDPGVVLVGVDAGRDAAGVSTAVERVTKRFGVASAQTKSEFVDDAAGEIDGVLAIVYVMLALSILIALMGIANTMSLSVHERTRELGLLRAIGQTQRQTRSMVRIEAAIISLFGTIAGVAIGVAMGWALVAGSGTAGVGVFAAPIGQLLIVTVVGGLVGVLAGRRPAKRAARLDILGAIASG